jgi:hypothetical protein
MTCQVVEERRATRDASRNHRHVDAGFETRIACGDALLNQRPSPERT